MKTLVIGDYDTLAGTQEKPGKVHYLRKQGIEVNGVQIISLANDLLPTNLVKYHEKVLALLEKIPDLKRVSVALLCWPLLKTVEDGKVVDVAASTFLDADMFCYALGICSALQKVRDITGIDGIDVDVSYHPMLTVPRLLVEAGIIKSHIVPYLIDQEMAKRKVFQSLLDDHDIKDVGINIENEPTTSDANANLIHIGNRLWTETLSGLPQGWGITADLQHLVMALHFVQFQHLDHLSLPKTLQPFIPCFHSHLYSEMRSCGGFDALEIRETIRSIGNLEHQFHALEAVKGTVTFHISQIADRFYHLSPPLDFSGSIWSQILSLMSELDWSRNGKKIWYAAEIGGSHISRRLCRGFEGSAIPAKIFWPSIGGVIICLK